METPRPPLVTAELSTARLVLRPLDPALDAADLFEMDADPLVHQYVYGSSPSHSIEQLQRRLAATSRSRCRRATGSAYPAPPLPPTGPSDEVGSPTTLKRASSNNQLAAQAGRETMTGMSVIDELLDNNRRYAETFVGMVPLRPAKKLAVVACMDSRIDVHALLGLKVGDAHIIRNGGGVISPDVIRSLTISQRVTGTREIILIHHTDCANLGLDEMKFKAELQAEVGFKPDWSFDSFTDLEEDLRQSVLRLRSNPFIAYTDKIRGFIFDVATGKLAEVV